MNCIECKGGFKESDSVGSGCFLCQDCWESECAGAYWESTAAPFLQRWIHDLLMPTWGNVDTSNWHLCHWQRHLRWFVPFCFYPVSPTVRYWLWFHTHGAQWGWEMFDGGRALDWWLSRRILWLDVEDEGGAKP